MELKWGCPTVLRTGQLLRVGICGVSGREEEKEDSL